MVNLIFNNSYQNSFIGFQTSQYAVGIHKLNTAADCCCLCEETEQLLTNSGCVCAIGKSQNTEIRYFVYRGLIVADFEGREWYINIGIESDKQSENQFVNIITNILLDFNVFKSNLKKWFTSTPNSMFSYDLNYECVDVFVSGASRIFINEINFYKTDNPYIFEFKEFIVDFSNGEKNDLLLLIPETTEGYFNKQNPIFESREKHYVFQPNVFKGLVNRNIELLTQRKNVKAKSETQKNDKKRFTTNDNPMGEFVEDNKHTIEVICKIAIGALTIIGTGVLVKKIFRGAAK